MLRYRYDVKWDLQNAKWISSKRKWFDENNIVVFYPNFFRWIWLMFWMSFSKKPDINTPKEITCFWLSSGPWVAHHPDRNAISICPWKVEDSPGGNLESLIVHELVHLEHPELNNMSFEEREKLVDTYTKEFY